MTGDRGPWPLDFVPLSPEPEEPDLARPGSFWPTVAGVALLAVITAGGLVGMWVLAEAIAP